MEVYILDSLYRRVDVVDRFESLIWKERWRDIGDFQLVIPSTTKTRSLFKEDMPLGLNESKRVMIVETIEDSTDADGALTLTVTGRSIERILQDRVARNSKATTDAQPQWIIVGLPKEVAEYMFSRVCVQLALDPSDGIPLYAAGTSYPTDTIVPFTTPIRWEQDPDSLFQAIKDVCDIYDMGFRLYRNGDSGQLYFNIYTGTDRTTQQTDVSPVVFSPELETVQATKELRTIETAKNVAYVVSDQGFEMVYGEGVSPTITGKERRVLLVKADKLVLEDPNGDPLDPTVTEISNHLIQKGTEELAKNRSYMGFDGEITQRTPYKYDVHYSLGDLTEMRNHDGNTSIMRVTEQIFASDNEGDRSYPTLSAENFLVTGTWDSWLGNKNWEDMGPTEYWNTQP